MGIIWRRQQHPTPVLLPGKSHGGRSLEPAVHGVAEGWTWLSDFTFTFHFHALEKEVATQSSVLAWRIPGTGEPGGLPSIGSHRVGHDWSDLAAAAAWESFYLSSLQKMALYSSAHKALSGLTPTYLYSSFPTAPQSMAYAPAQDTPSVSPEESSQIDLLLEPFLIPKCKLNALTLGSHFNLCRTTYNSYPTWQV